MSFWMAFISVLAIVGIIVAGGVILSIFGKAILVLFVRDNKQVKEMKEYDYSNSQNFQDEYALQRQHEAKQTADINVAQTASTDYNYALDVDDNQAKVEENNLANELRGFEDEDDFFKDFAGDNDKRFGEMDDLADADLMGMIDEISTNVLDEEEIASVEQDKRESEENQSVLDQYSIDNYFNEEADTEFDDLDEEEELNEIVNETEQTTVEEFDAEESVAAEENLNGLEDFEEEEDEVEHIVDETTMEELNKLKEEVKGITEYMEQNRNENQTFNEQLIGILNELKEANKEKQIRTSIEAEKEIESLKAQLEESRQEMERQVQERVADKDAEMQDRLQQQLDASNAEIESLKVQLAALLQKMDEDEGKEVEPIVEPIVEEDSEITALRSEVKEMLESMREENDTKTAEFNAQLIAILNEMKEASLKKSEEIKVETAEDAANEVDEWKNRLEEAQTEMQKEFNEQLLHKDEETKAQLQAQKDEYNAEIENLKGQLNEIIAEFKAQSESDRNENQALIDELEKERQERIRLEQVKLDAEKENATQLEELRKENERLSDMLHTRDAEVYEPLTDEEMDDLYSETTDIDYSAIKKMYDEEVTEKVKESFEESKAEIDELKEQVSRLTAFMQEREESLAGQINVHEVKLAEFDVEQLKEVTAKEVEARVKEKLSESLDEVNALKKELAEAKKELERQYKEQIADKKAAMEYDVVSNLQASAEEIEDINHKLDDLTTDIKKEQSEVKATSKECAAEIESNRESKEEEARIQLAEIDSEKEVTIVGPKNNTVALVTGDAESEELATIDMETVNKLTEAEIDEMIAKRLSDSNKEIEALKEQIATLKEALANKDEDDSDSQSGVPVVRSPLFDVEAIKTITAQEVETKVQERLAEAMSEIEEMKKQLELSKQEIERQYKEQLNSKSEELEYEMRARLKGSAAEVVELKEQLADLTEQLELERQEAKNNSESIAVQLEEERKVKEEIAKQQLAEFATGETSMAIATREVTVIGPKNNQVALVTGGAVASEEVEFEDDIPTIDIDTVKQLAEQEIEEKVEQRLTSSTIEIEELKKQILNLSIQIQEMKDKPSEDAEKPVVFHYSTEEAYLERIAILEERLKVAKKDLKINNKELNPLEKVNRTLERDKAKLRRKEAIAAKKKVALYGVNNYVDIDKEKAEKLAQELELLDGLRLSVSHCEEVMNANVDRYPILLHTDQILRENIANIESDISTLNKELQLLREKNGAND